MMDVCSSPVGETSELNLILTHVYATHSIFHCLVQVCYLHFYSLQHCTQL